MAEVRRGLRIVLVMVAAAAGLMVPARGALAENFLHPDVLVSGGDSVAAGAGLPLMAGASAEDTACGRSDQAYPALMAAGLKMRFVPRACSGATTVVGMIGPQPLTASEAAPSQLLGASRQEEPFDYVMTVGANDVSWGYFIQKCLTSTCGTADDTTQFNEQLRTMKAGLVVSLVGLEFTEAHHVYVTGYYDPFYDQAQVPGFTTPELVWFRTRMHQVNSAIADSASHFDQTTFVPVSFSGGGPGLVQGLRDPAPFHPTAAGQRVIAREVLALYPH
jgi:lysophospholipase L1-like esterase